MIRFAHLLALVVSAMIPATAAAHRGHGSQIPSSLLHLAEPEHLSWILIAIGLGALALRYLRAER